MNDGQRWRPATGYAPPGDYEIELRMRALREHVPALRALVTDWALRENHDLDFVDDIRLAVDEVFAIMIDNCTRDDMVTARLVVSPAGVEFDAWVAVSAGTTPSAGGLSMRVLAALADSLDYQVSETTSDEQVLRLRYRRAMFG